MRYSSSLTSSVREFVEDYLARRITEANSGQDLGSTALQIRENLSDPENVSTVDFVLRRYIQSRVPSLLEGMGELPDLVHGKKNLPWDKKVLRRLARILEKESLAEGAKIEDKEWYAYLTGSSPRKREKLFMAAFTLGMSVEDTMDLLLACGKEPYSVRNPLDLICMFCQSAQETYAWAEAEDMYRQFLEGKKAAGSSDAGRPTAGMTEKLSGKLHEIFRDGLREADARKALLAYMIENSAEFPSYEKVVKAEKAFDGTEEKRDRITRTVFLEGYSTERLALFERLAEYLAVLYPRYSTIDAEKDGEGENRGWDQKTWNRKWHDVVDGQGTISLRALSNAMMEKSLWKDIVWAGGKEDPFERKMRELCGNYEKHMMAVERMRRGGNNPAFFERRDALLFVYFFISGFIEVCTGTRGEDRERYARLQELSFRDHDLDMAVEEIMEKVERVLLEEEDPKLRFDCLRECFNMILAQLEYPNLYLPAQFDRFVLLSLLAEDPAELSALVMSRGDWEFQFGGDTED